MATTVEQADLILRKLRDNISDVEDDATFYAMRDAYKTIRAWSANGAMGQIPFATELVMWGILRNLPGTNLSEDDSVDNGLLSSPVDSSKQLTEQELYDEAITLLQNGRYYAAYQSLFALQKEAVGHLQVAITLSCAEAQNKLSKQTGKCREKAISYTEKCPNDFRGQRSLWKQVLEVNPDDGKARLALHHIEEREQADNTVTEMEQLHQDANNALVALRLSEMNRTLGQAENLQQNNILPHLQSKLDDLVQYICRLRDQLRSQLGSASTLAVSGNQREAYRQAKEYVDKGMVVIFDQAGITGEVGEVDSYLFYQETGKRFRASLRDLAQQRFSQADAQKKQNPALALKTLQDTRQLLQDDILNKEDRYELQPTLNEIEQEIECVEERLHNFEYARAKVLDADSPGQLPEDKYRLYREAREIYPDYPSVDNYVAEAAEIVTTITAGQLQEKIIRAQRRRERDDYEGALELLQVSRQQALIMLSSFKSDSHLTRILDEVTRLEQDIITDERYYQHMMRTLGEIDNLLNDYDRQIPKNSNVLFVAQMHLETLKDHPETSKRRFRLLHLQDEAKIHEAESAIESRELTMALATLSQIQYLKNDSRVTVLILDTVSDYIHEKIQIAQEASEQFRFKYAQDILTQTKTQISSWISNFAIVASIFSEVDSILQEVSDYREAFRDLREANAYLEQGRQEEQIDELVQKALQLPYSTKVGSVLAHQARFLLAQRAFRQAEYEDYKRRLFEMLVDNPLDEAIRWRYEWFQKHENYQRWIADLLYQAKVWFWGSVFTALILLGISIYVILITVNRNDPVATLSSLVSLVPVIASKLVYDQSKAAYERAKEIEGRMESEKLAYAQHVTHDTEQ